ncbi:MAG TPA: hypothetical protein VNA69_20485 [Thermoanaerobaculia bacterium]|nr:hypothetical protein [Thermoanaerobaculia bacterium]
MKRETGAFAFFLVLAIALTWPLVLHLDTAVPDRGDPLFVAFVLDWVCHALTHAPLELYNPPIFHPGLYPLAYSENMIAIALVVLPLHLLGVAVLTKYNIALLLGLAFAGYGAWVLARVVTRNNVASLIAGIFFAFGSFKIAHIQHAHIIWSGWLPLILAALLIYWRRGEKKHAAMLAAAFVMNGLTNVYWLLFGGVALLAAIGVLAIADPRRERVFWTRLFVALFVAGLVLLPFLLPYQAVANEYGVRRTTGEASAGSASWISWLVPSSRSAIYGDLADPALHLDERELFPGVLILFLAIYALCTRPNVATGFSRSSPGPAKAGPYVVVAIIVFAILTWLTVVHDRITIGRFSFAGSDVPAMILVALLIALFMPRLRAAARTSRFTPEELAAAVWIVAGFIASLGWNAFLHPFLFRVIEAFRATRTPARWAVIVYAGLAVWAAMGAAALLERTKRRRAMAALLLVLAVVEVWPKLKWVHVDASPAPVYRWLAKERPGAVVELPMLAEGVPFEYLIASTMHRVPLINGTSGWEPPSHQFLREKETKLEYDDAFLRALIENGCTTVIVHEARMTPEQRSAVAPLLARLEPLQRFGSDAVFRIPRAPAGNASAPRESPPR